MRIHAHLTFHGNCRQAMTFYQRCLGGELTFQTVGECPYSAALPASMKKCIVQATLVRDSLVLMGSDMVADGGLIKGNAVTLALYCDSKAGIQRVYRKLAVGGHITHPLGRTVWGAFFAGVTDKFGNHWLLSSRVNT